jgi:hypothetical protein
VDVANLGVEPVGLGRRESWCRGDKMDQAVGVVSSHKCIRTQLKGEMDSKLVSTWIPGDYGGTSSPP